VPETLGTPVVILAPVIVEAAPPEGFVDIDVLVEEQELDPVSRQAIKAGREAVADNYYNTEPKTLAWYRLKKGWSQKELAGRMKTSQSYIARLEAGEIDPQVSTLRRLAGVLEVLPAVLLDAAPLGARQS
jgi:ribosome-binding protein aMBF1 (putative translation factor)